MKGKTLYQVPKALRGAVLCCAALAATSLPGAPLAAQDSTTAPTAAARSTTPAAFISLGEAARIAARNNASAQSARVRVGEAQARVTERRADLLPTLSASGSQETRTLNTASFGISFPAAPGKPPLFNPNGEVIPPFSVVDYRGRVVLPLLDFSAIARLRGARASVTASRAEATVTSEQAASQAAIAYVRALRAADDFRARSEDSVLAADLANVAQAQLQAGTGVALDVTRARSQLVATRAQLIASRAARDRTRIDLARALNLPLGTRLVLADSLGALDSTGVSTDEQTATSRALQNRPDLLAAQARVAAARQTISSVRAERLPTLSFIGNDGVNGKNYSRLLNTYDYGVQLSVPILDGFRREGRIQEQQGVVREAEIQQNDIEQQAAADVRGALIDLESASEQLGASRERLALAQQEVTQARERFSAGVAGNADVITALLSLTGGRTAVIDAQTNYQAARIALARAQGAVTTLP